MKKMAQLLLVPVDSLANGFSLHSLHIGLQPPTTTNAFSAAIVPSSMQHISMLGRFSRETSLEGRRIVTTAFYTSWNVLDDSTASAAIQ